jgi:hypothetical protein
MPRVRALQTRLLPHGPWDLVRQVLLFFVAYNGYRLVRGLADDPGVTAAAFEHARALIGLERGIHVFADVASWLYLNAQTSVTLSALAYLYLFHNRNFYFVRNMFMVAMAVALLGYLFYPTAPPRFLPEWGFTDSVANFTGVGHDNTTVDALFNPYAAVPSMHTCFALLIGFSLTRLVRNRIGRVFWAMYPLLIVFVIVATGNHFLSDAFLGACTAGLSAYAASWLARARPTVWAFSRTGVTA